jgi:hypothetical protein
VLSNPLDIVREVDVRWYIYIIIILLGISDIIMINQFFYMFLYGFYYD